MDGCTPTWFVFSFSHIVLPLAAFFAPIFIFPGSNLSIHKMSDDIQLGLAKQCLEQCSADYSKFCTKKECQSAEALSRTFFGLVI